MKNHYIICGAGATGIHVIREMHQSQKPFIVIDSDEAKFTQLREEFNNCMVLIGDATSDTILQEANIRKAQGLVTTLDNDKDNLFLTVTARMINPDIQIICTAKELSMHEKLTKAGANYIVSPDYIGGMRIASHVLRPAVVSFLDRMLRAGDSAFRIEEVVIPPRSPVHGKTMAQANIHGKTSLNIIAYSPEGNDGNYIYNLSDDTLIKAGGVLLFIGSPQQQQQLAKLVDE